MWTIDCIDYEMCLALKLTLEAESFQEIEAHVEGKPLNLWHIPERFSKNVNDVIQASMKWEPKKRITAAKLAEYLRLLLGLMKYSTNNTGENNSFLTTKWP
jgi:hypothetical protein